MKNMLMLFLLSLSMQVIADTIQDEMKEYSFKIIKLSSNSVANYDYLENKFDVMNNGNNQIVAGYMQFIDRTWPISNEHKFVKMTDANEVCQTFGYDESIAFNVAQISNAKVRSNKLYQINVSKSDGVRLKKLKTKDFKDKNFNGVVAYHSVICIRANQEGDRNSFISDLTNIYKIYKENGSFDLSNKINLLEDLKDETIDLNGDQRQIEDKSYMDFKDYSKAEVNSRNV